MTRNRATPPCGDDYAIVDGQLVKRRYEVVDAITGDCFGNHTFTEAVARAQVMRRNWNHQKQFLVKERAT
jgi:hypothetical protein